MRVRSSRSPGRSTRALSALAHDRGLSASIFDDRSCVQGQVVEGDDDRREMIDLPFDRTHRSGANEVLIRRLLFAVLLLHGIAFVVFAAGHTLSTLVLFLSGAL